MLECSKAAAPEDKERYDAVHKMMKQFARDWNRIEHIRET